MSIMTAARSRSSLSRSTTSLADSGINPTEVDQSSIRSGGTVHDSEPEAEAELDPKEQLSKYSPHHH
jgi:hypothetical protein